MSETRDHRPGHAADLDEDERKNAQEEQSLDAKTTHAVIRLEGERELERSNGALAWSGLAAGLAMGFSLVAQGVLHHALPDAPWRPLDSSSRAPGSTVRQGVARRSLGMTDGARRRQRSLHLPCPL